MLSQQLENLLPKEVPNYNLACHPKNDLIAGQIAGFNSCLSQCKQSIPEMLKLIREEIEKGLEIELCEWMRKDGYSAEYAKMKKQDILDLLK